MSKVYGSHIPVLYQEILDLFADVTIDQNTSELCFADLTFGGGGHTGALLERFPKAKVIAVDQDPDAIKNGTAIYEDHLKASRLQLFWGNFALFPEEFRERKFHGILMDLGVSSHQLDSDYRGFSFRRDGELDMRMNYQSEERATAKELIQTLSEEDLADIIFHYGEERFSRRIARAIVERRQEKAITTTKELEDLVFHAYPSSMRYQSTHPATRTFQALRIMVNGELDVLSGVLPKLYQMLHQGGVLACISFHSLEDRIVKNTFKDLGKKSIITKKPKIPSEEEQERNPRSRSAKLRVIQKT